MIRKVSVSSARDFPGFDVSSLRSIVWRRSAYQRGEQRRRYPQISTPRRTKPQSYCARNFHRCCLFEQSESLRVRVASTVNRVAFQPTPYCLRLQHASFPMGAQPAESDPSALNAHQQSQIGAGETTWQTAQTVECRQIGVEVHKLCA